MLQNVFSHRPPLQNSSNNAEITEVPAGCRHFNVSELMMGP